MPDYLGALLCSCSIWRSTSGCSSTPCTPCAMYALLGVMLVSRYLARQWIENVSTARECSRLTAEMGDKAAVIVTVANEEKLPVAWLLLEDSVPGEALVQRPPRIGLERRRFGILQLRPRRPPLGSSGRGRKEV